MKQVKNLKLYKKALIIVDMVNGFVREGILHDEKIAETIPRQLELIKDYKKKEELIIFVKDTHDENSVEHNRFQNPENKKHCIKGSGEEELVEELKPYEHAPNTISIEKNSTSYMEAPEFREVIKEATNLETVDVVGCCTDICDINGTIGLANYFDQWNRNVTINLHQDAVATYAEEARQNYVDAAYLLMEQQGIQLVKKK